MDTTMTWHVQLGCTNPPSAELRRELEAGFAAAPNVVVTIDVYPWPPAPDGGQTVSCSVGCGFPADRLPEDIASGLRSSLLRLAPGTTWWWINIGAGPFHQTYVIPGAVDIRGPLESIFDSDLMHSSTKRWTADHWLDADLGAYDPVLPTPDSLIVSYVPGQINFTDKTVPSTEIVNLFAGAHVIAGRLAPGSIHWGQKGGGGGFTPVTIEIVITAAAGIFTAAFIGAIAKDTWEALKRGIHSIRHHPEPAVANARISMAALLPGRGWITFLGGPIDEEALARLEQIDLPSLPEERFDWALEWEPARKRWVLLLDRPHATRPPLPGDAS